MRKIVFLNLLIWILLLTSDTVWALLFKVAAMNFKKGIWLNNIAFILAYTFELFSFLLWMWIIKYNRLSISLSLTAITYISVPVCSYLFFHEIINLTAWIGIFFIAVGAATLGFYSGEKRTEPLQLQK
jgi:drug/metabolite transporter (DMT)-like permease